MLRVRTPTATALMLLSLLLVASSTSARQLLQADQPDPTPPKGGQAVAKADLPVPERLKNLGTNAPPSPPVDVPATDGRRLLSASKTESVTAIQWHGGSKETRQIPRVAKGHKTEGNRPRWVSSAADPETVTADSSSESSQNGTDSRNLAILYNDDRTIYNDMRYPWGTLVKVYNLAGKYGSGVLIGPRHVLTASHVINWDSPRVKVEVGRFGTTTVATSYSRSIWSYVQVRGDPTYSTVDEDYAVITLQDDLGNRFGWMGTKTYDSAWDGDAYWTNIAYPGDRYTTNPALKGNYPTKQGPKYLDEDAFDFGTGRAMTTDADTYPGMSGSPMFGWWSGQPYVVAVVSSEGTAFLGGYQNWCSGGSELTSLVKYVRDNDP